MTSLRYWFKIYDDYRSGPSLSHFIDKEDVEEFGDIKLELPETGFRIYILEESPLIHIVLNKDFNDFQDAKTFVLQTYSKFNECTPFVVTGYNSAYKEKGEYGDEIKVTYGEISILDCDKYSDSYVYGIVIDDEGEILYDLSITPPE